jgi:hypothetical protein
MIVIGIALLMSDTNAQYNSGTTGYEGRNPYQIPDRQRNIYNSKSSENQNSGKRNFFSNDVNGIKPSESNSSRKGNFFSNDVTVNEAPPEFPDNVDASIPVDGGLGLLLAAGVGYGVRRLKKKKDKKQREVGS